MKKLLLFVTVALMSLSLSAQDGLKGVWFAGGQLSFGSDKEHKAAGELKTTNTTALPIIGTFVTPSVAVGAGLGYMGSNQKIEGETINKSNSLVVKPLVRKYWNIAGGLYFYGQAAVPFIMGSGEKGEVGVPKGKYDNLSVALELAPGFDYVINSWITIETSFTIASLGYKRTKPDGGRSDSSFKFDANPFNSIGDRTVGELQVGVKFLF